MSGKSPNTPGHQPTDNAKKVLKEVEDVKAIMAENITKMANQIDDLDVIEDKSKTMLVTSGQFVKGTQTLKHRMWCQNAKLNLIIGGIVLVIVLIIVLSLVIPRINN